MKRSEQDADLRGAYRRIRQRTVELSKPLSAEDQLVQPMPEASPTKWHLAHTTWFFEELVLGSRGDGGAPSFDPQFAFLFNSYYEALGPRVERGRRGMLSRPSLERVHAYRTDVDHRMDTALAAGALNGAALERLVLGLHHEQQHQELLLTDAAYVLGTQPLRPAYREDLAGDVGGGPGGPGAVDAEPLRYVDFGGGIQPIGAPAAHPDDRDGFAFDNERPRHDVLLRPFSLATRPLANADVLAFIEAGGYRDARHWLSDGWSAVQHDRWTAPLYWVGDGKLWTLGGVRAIDPAETACHLSYYEADAIARWLGARLPTEAEWEIAAQATWRDRGRADEHANFADADRLHPTRPARTATAHASAAAPAQMFGDVWEWTQSSYSPYPGFRPFPGALGEYNGKFMSGQQVLRGGSCLTPRGHVRPSYRNFFPPSTRWQMSGARLARDAG